MTPLLIKNVRIVESGRRINPGNVLIRDERVATLSLIETGADAEVVLWEDELRPARTCVRGTCVFSA